MAFLSLGSIGSFLPETVRWDSVSMERLDEGFGGLKPATPLRSQCSYSFKMAVTVRTGTASGSPARRSKQELSLEKGGHQSSSVMMSALFHWVSKFDQEVIDECKNRGRSSMYGLYTIFKHAVMYIRIA